MTPRSGEQCSRIECAGVLHVYASRRVGEFQQQYLECDVCRAKPDGNPVIVPASSIRRRRRKQLSLVSTVHTDGMIQTSH